MHIAWLGKKSPFCGNVTYGREVTNALLDRGHRVSFFHFSQADREDEVPDNVPNFQEVTIPFLFKSQIYTLPKLRSSRVLLRSLKKLKPDVVHASLTLSPLDFRLPELCEELGVPLVATFHPAFDNQLRNWASGTQYLMYQLYAPALANYDRVIVFSYLQKDLLVKLGVPAERVAVIPNGVDVDKYCPGESRYRGRWRGDRVFVYQGRIAPEKNVEALLRAWKASNMGANSKLLMVGSGPLLSSLRSQYGEEIGVKWLGFVAEEAKRIEILRSADVFILPSLVEGLSLSLLEAMACGLACIATDAGADGEVLEDGAGVIMRTTQSVATQLQTLLPLFRDHPELTKLLGQKSRQRVLDRYTLSNNITRVEALYESILGTPRVPLNLSSRL
ncbi:glycosyltransferase family 4 protein [Alkalinema pantanalense CENA528]|uniref:glycosyltransferase family 4 protein n=1 Tax=Alkalinema pantanalense TaxID=1620705 RepID=UPI003D6DBEE3